MMIEQNTNYAYKLKYMDNLLFNNRNLAKNLNYRENMIILHKFKFAAYTKETTDGSMAKNTNPA